MSLSLSQLTCSCRRNLKFSPSNTLICRSRFSVASRLRRRHSRALSRFFSNRRSFFSDNCLPSRDAKSRLEDDDDDDGGVATGGAVLAAATDAIGRPPPTAPVLVVLPTALVVPVVATTGTEARARVNGEGMPTTGIVGKDCTRGCCTCCGCCACGCCCGRCCCSMLLMVPTPPPTATRIPQSTLWLPLFSSFSFLDGSFQFRRQRRCLSLSLAAQRR